MQSKFVWLVISACCCLNGVIGSCVTSWTSYNEEKCFKVFASEFDTNEQGVDFCTLQLTGASLLTIKSLDEQEFVEKLVFDDSSIVDNVWLGAKRSLSGDFFWNDDGSIFEYTNWALGSPSNDQDKECVQMVSHLSKGSVSTKAEGDGFWTDVSCLARKIVVCQAPSTLNQAEIQAMLLEARKVGLETRKALLETKERVLYLENNPVPVGFIYVQLANQPTPLSLWPSCNWTQVTSNYSGLFFRAEGGKSESFGSTQTENSPRLKAATFDSSSSIYPRSVTIPIGGYTGFMLTAYQGSTNGYGAVNFFVDYTNTAKPEVRPVNSAVRIWIRTV